MMIDERIKNTKGRQMALMTRNLKSQKAQLTKALGRILLICGFIKSGRD